MRWLLVFLGLMGCSDEGLDTLDDTEVLTETGELDDTGDSEDTDVPDVPKGAVLYPTGQIHSPITSGMAREWRDQFDAHSNLTSNVFMKVGASSTVSKRTLYCFAGDDVVFAEFDHLEPTLAFYLTGDIDGKTPFDRDTLAAVSGRTARWAVSGSPSPLEREFEVSQPSFALIHYGTNDMGMGSTYCFRIY